MNKSSARKGDNLVEYIVVLMCVGLVMGTALMHIDPKVFRNYFSSTFNPCATPQNNGNLFVFCPMTN